MFNEILRRNVMFFLEIRFYSHETGFFFTLYKCWTGFYRFIHLALRKIPLLNMVKTNVKDLKQLYKATTKEIQRLPDDIFTEINKMIKNNKSRAIRHLGFLHPEKNVWWSIINHYYSRLGLCSVTPSLLSIVCDIFL